MANLHKPAKITYTLGADSGYMPHLDGWRGAAILWVLVFHYFREYKLAGLGWAGVNCFFILSGYLITGRLFALAGKAAGEYFTVFYVRRILRIFPLYYGCLVFFFLLLPLVYSHYMKNFADLCRHQGWFWFYVNNWYIVIYGHQANTTLDSFWSLAVEEQFYLCWPFLFRYIKGRGIKVVMLSLMAASIIGRGWITPEAYYSTLTACEPLLLGVFICMIEKEGRQMVYSRYLLPVFVLSVLILGLVFVHDSDQWISNTWLIQYGYTAIDCILACLLYASLLPDRRGELLRKVLTFRWLRWVGKYSYGIYVFHWILFTTVVKKAELEMTGRGIDGTLAYWLTRLAGIGVVLVGAYASYHLYEQKFLKLKKYFA